jgi:integrase/recombinase XerD
MKVTKTKGNDHAVIKEFLDAVWLESGLSENTLLAYRRDLQDLSRWLNTHKRGKDSGGIKAASRADILRYLAHLSKCAVLLQEFNNADSDFTKELAEILQLEFNKAEKLIESVPIAVALDLSMEEAGKIGQCLEKAGGSVKIERVTARTQARRLSVLRRFFDYLVGKQLRADNPTQGIKFPKFGSPLPDTLSEADVINLLEAPDIGTTLGLRDRAILETLYATGLRVSELVNLSMSELSQDREVVQIMGKGGRERVVPLGNDALDALDEYLSHARFKLVGRKTSNAVFLTRRGAAMTRQAFWYMLNKYVGIAGIEKKISPHTLRHSVGAHLVNRGADLVVIKMLLGHSSLSTTQIYTQVGQRRLIELHEEHHPRGGNSKK